MTDMLVPLYNLPIQSRQAELADGGITIARGMAADKVAICGFVADNFGSEAAGWVSECEASLLRMAGTCFIAVQNRSVISIDDIDAPTLTSTEGYPGGGAFRYPQAKGQSDQD